jgi:hypothetical protein
MWLWHVRDLSEPKISTLYNFKICMDYKKDRQVKKLYFYLLVVFRI